MKTNFNLHRALQQCRTARRMGKISAEVQQRTLRRLWHDGDAPEQISNRNWGRLMALRARIEKEVRPAREALISARWEVFRTKDDRPMAVAD